MPYVVVEKAAESMDSQLDENGIVKDVVQRSFIAYEDPEGGVSAPFDMVAVLALPDLPQINDEHPVVLGTRVKKRTINRMEDRTEAYEIQYTYEYDPTSGGNEQEISIVSTSSEVTGEFVDVYRVAPAYPYDTAYPGTDDIGGTKVDSAGTPTSTFRRQVTYEKSFDTEYVDLPYVFSFVGTRNGVWWQGFGPGTLLYIGCSLSVQTGGLINRTDRFIYDADYHLRQIVNTFDGDLNPKLDANGNAEAVRWVQPFPSLSNFFALGIPE